jgi:hypothetical protein
MMQFTDSDGNGNYPNFPKFEDLHCKSFSHFCHHLSLFEGRLCSLESLFLQITNILDVSKTFPFHKATPAANIM